MLELILVRHGETESNLRGTYCGWTDAELTEKGWRQASDAARKLKDLNFDKVYSSPLRRALNTAETICRGKDTPIICSDSLKEHNFGKWEDMTHAEIADKYPEESKAWERDWVNFRIEGGESAIEGYRRIVSFSDGIVQGCKEGTMLVVTHLGCIRYILVHLLDMPIEGIWRFGIDNGGISKIRINSDGYAYLTALNI